MPAGGSRAKVCFVLAACFSSLTAVAQSGEYVGTPVTRWEADGRSMILMGSFEYVDGNGRSWHVPNGVRIDGASIPGAFWSLIGAPFEGKYREASIIHDYFCEQRRRRWQDVHKVFHEAMLTSGVGSAKAFVMYKTVEKFGPRWDEPKVNPKCLRPDGKFDFDSCTENSGYLPTNVTMPHIGKSELEGLIEEVKGQASPDDVRALEDLAKKAGD